MMKSSHSLLFSLYDIAYLALASLLQVSFGVFVKMTCQAPQTVKMICLRGVGQAFLDLASIIPVVGANIAFYYSFKFFVFIALNVQSSSSGFFRGHCLLCAVFSAICVAMLIYYLGRTLSPHA